MTVLTYLSVFVEIACSLLLIGAILIQRTKGQGLGGMMGGAMGEAIFGTQMGTVLTRATVVLAIVFLVNTTLLAWLGSRSGGSSIMDGTVVPPAGPAPAEQAGMQPEQPMEPLAPMEVAPVDVGQPVEVDAPAVPDAPVVPAAVPAPEAPAGS
jgi:protein translocase SecG subunit